MSKKDYTPMEPHIERIDQLERDLRATLQRAETMVATGASATHIIELFRAINATPQGQGTDASARPGRPVAQDAHAPASAASSETPRTDRCALPAGKWAGHIEVCPASEMRRLEREPNAWEAKFNAECEKHDATTLRAMKAERDLAAALDHIEKDTKEIERLHEALNAVAPQACQNHAPFSESGEQAVCDECRPSHAGQRTEWPLDTLVSVALDDLFVTYGLQYPQSHSDLRRCFAVAEKWLRAKSASGDKLIPRQPTMEMREAGRAVHHTQEREFFDKQVLRMRYDLVTGIWQAMYDAALSAVSD